MSGTRQPTFPGGKMETRRAKKTRATGRTVLAPNYLQMMDELIGHLQRLYLLRFEFVMTYSGDGIGHL